MIYSGKFSLIIKPLLTDNDLIQQIPTVMYCC